MSRAKELNEKLIESLNREQMQASSYLSEVLTPYIEEGRARRAAGKVLDIIQDALIESLLHSEISQEEKDRFEINFMSELKHQS